MVHSTLRLIVYKLHLKVKKSRLKRRYGIHPEKQWKFAIYTTSVNSNDEIYMPNSIKKTRKE